MPVSPNAPEKSLKKLFIEEYFSSEQSIEDVAWVARVLRSIVRTI